MNGFVKNDGGLPEVALTEVVAERVAPSGGSDAVAAKSLGRIVAIIMVLIGSIVMAVGMTSCVDDDDAPASEWYLGGVWQNNSYPDEDMVFYPDGTGYWESVSTGSYLDFSYYCFGDWIYFTFYPEVSPAYDMDCAINLINGGNMGITWPAGSFYGPVTLYYTRVE